MNGAVVSRNTVRVIAESVGIAHLKDDVADLLHGLTPMRGKARGGNQEHACVDAKTARHKKNDSKKNKATAKLAAPGACSP